MRLRESSIDLYGFQRRGLRLWQRLVWRYRPAGIRRTQEIISVCEATVSQRERRIFFYRLLKVFERLLQAFFGAFVEIKPSFQLKLIGLVTFGVVFRESSLLPGDFKLELVNDLARDL